eukprot:TRINITY_DN3943_c0_g1_i9.p1 TRINITY_DN3943_c0_g1~~TRINITY_DN3943_c0_g1_i9.p1  ORF type:complete len:134 (-),score=13.82 TRINITY_DN3943_c0_g1_i9:102-503(-)
MWTIYKLFNNKRQLNEGRRSTIFYCGVREDPLEILEGYTCPAYYKFLLNFRVCKPYSDIDTTYKMDYQTDKQQYGLINPKIWKTTQYIQTHEGVIAVDRPREFYNTIKINENDTNFILNKNKSLVTSQQFGYF